MNSDYEIIQNIIKLSEEQNNNKKIPSDTYYSYMLKLIIKYMNTENVSNLNNLKQCPIWTKIYNNIKLHLTLFSEGRFVDYFSRVSINDGKCSYNQFSPGKKIYLRDNIFQNWMSVQGKSWGPIIYKSLQLYKTHYDYTIYPMILQDIKPKTIIELGSGNGSSAIWMNDLCKSFQLDTKMYSLDIYDVNIYLKGKKMYKPLLDINFIQGDVYNIEKYFPVNLLEKLEHPWLIIEDCHHNTYNMMVYFHTFLKQNDYIIIEDPDEIDFKTELHGLSLIKFMKEYHNQYVIDTKYCDFFGKNNCSFPDSIFKYIS
jgi:cephalosporin hydroxylase